VLGALTFAAATVGLLIVQEVVRPDWRDPEFGFRLLQIREWQKKSPDRPLVLAFGSSRMQFALAPAAMGFPNEPGQPLIYNCAYRAAPPNLAALNVLRVIDAGIRPRAVLIEFVPRAHIVLGMMRSDSLNAFLRKWTNRFSLMDVRRMAALEDSFGDDRAASLHWFMGYAAPWTTQRLVLGLVDVVGAFTMTGA
jgi:hypothetical protein